MDAVAVGLGVGHASDDDGAVAVSADIAGRTAFVERMRGPGGTEHAAGLDSNVEMHGNDRHENQTDVTDGSICILMVMMSKATVADLQREREVSRLVEVAAGHDRVVAVALAQRADSPGQCDHETRAGGVERDRGTMRAEEERDVVGHARQEPTAVVREQTSQNKRSVSSQMAVREISERGEQCR